MERGSYLENFQDKRETPDDRLERAKGIYESLAPQRSNLTEADEVDFQPDLFSMATSIPVLSGLCLLPPRGRVRFFSLENGPRM